MKPLYVLLATFLIVMLITFLSTGTADVRLSGNIAMSAMLVFTAIGHFAFTKGMTMMVPDFLPFKKLIVIITGILEITAAITLLINNINQETAYFLIVFFIILLPANIYAAAKMVDYQKGTLDGPGLKYLWFRVPLQLFFIGWIWYFSI